MAREPGNLGASIRARLLERARAERSDFQILLTRYALERLLYRLSVSEHRNSFVLKGAMLFMTWIADPFRSTRDLDLLGFGEADAAALAECFRSICSQSVADDGVMFDIPGLEASPIRETMEYGGVRIRTTATIAGASIPIQIDIGFGDAITPAAVEIVYPVLLNAPAPTLRAYPIETVIAEKFEAMVKLGIANSRLKDFYDLWQIAQTFEFRQTELTRAAQRTFERRHTPLPTVVPTALTEEFAAAWAAQWQTFLGRERMAIAPRALGTVILDLREFLMPLCEAADERGVWLPGGPWRLAALDET